MGETVIGTYDNIDSGVRRHLRGKMISICVLLFALQSNAFSMSPRFRDVFSIENRTRQKIVVVFEGNRQPSHYLGYDCEDNDERWGYILLSFAPGANDPDKSFRTIRPKTLFHKGLYEIGTTQHNCESFNNKTPEEKFSAFFSSILIFNEQGDLLYKIDDFSKCRIEYRTKGYGFVLVIE